MTFANIKGTSTTPIAMKLDCSGSHHCTEITLKNIKLTYMKGATTSYCKNAHGGASGVVVPMNCMWSLICYMMVFVLLWCFFFTFETHPNLNVMKSLVWIEIKLKQSVWLLVYQCDRSMLVTNSAMIGKKWKKKKQYLDLQLITIL